MAILSAFASIFVIVDRLDGSVRLGDVDDRLRALEVGQLWSTGHWYDLTLSMIRMPEPYASPWSRLVDAPFIAITWILSLVVPPDTALQWSFLIWPPVMLLFYCGLVFSVLRRFPAMLRGSQAMVVVGAMVFMMPMLGEFTPGRIDHHNMQIVLVMFMLAGIMRWTAVGGIMTGVGAALSVAVGMETVPVIIVMLGGITIAWVAGVAGGHRMLASTMLTTIVATPVAALVLIGPVAMSSTHCDSFSAPHIYGLVAMPLALLLVLLVAGGQVSPVKRLVLVAVPCLALGAGFVLLFPACLDGPYAVVDPVSRHFWLDRIPQEKSGLELFRAGSVASVLLLTLQAMVVLLALPMVVVQTRRGRPQEAIVFAAVVTTLLLTFSLLRYSNFAAALLPLLLPLAFDRIVSLSQRGLRPIPVGSAAAIVVPGIIAATMLWATPARVRPADIFDLMGGDDCSTDDFGALSRLPAGIVMAPTGLSTAIAMRAFPGLSAASIPFHRSSPGLRRLYLAFTSHDPAVRSAALAPFDYVAVCRLAAATDREQAPLYAALASGDSWPGLVPIDIDPRARLRLFRIDHTVQQ